MRGTLARFYLFRSLGLTWIYVPFQWFYLRGQGLSATSLMGLNTVFCLSAVLLEVPTGALADRVGRKPVLVAGALASVVSCIAFVLLPDSFLGLAVANVLAALAMTSISGADSAYLFDLLASRGRSSDYQRAEATASAARLVAAAAGGVVAWALVSRGAGLQWLYAGTAVLTALAAAVGAGLPERRPVRAASGAPWSLSGALRESGRGVASHAIRGGRVVLSARSLLILLGISALLFPVLRVGLFLDQPYLEQLGYATALVGLAFAAKDMVAAVSAAWTPRLLGWLGEGPLFAILPLAVGGALLAMPSASGRAAGLLVLLPTAAFGIYSPLVRVFVNRRLPNGLDRATILSMEGMARRLGFALFSPLVGAVFDVWSMGAALRTSAIWAAASLALSAALIVVVRASRSSSPQGMTPGPPSGPSGEAGPLVPGPGYAALVSSDAGLRHPSLLSCSPPATDPEHSREGVETR